MSDFSYKVGDIDEVIDERGSSTLLLRKIAWGGGKENLELRKWFIDVDSMRASKGVTFLTDEGPSNLVKVLISKGYGDTKECLEVLKERDDFEPSLIKVIGKPTFKEIKNKEVTWDSPEDAYFDPKELKK